MTWTDLPTDYKDAVWKGNRKYVLSTNSDGTVSFEDKTEYTQKENSFFGAAEANQMNNAMNVLAKNITSVDTNAKTASDAATTATQKATVAANSASDAANSATIAAESATEVQKGAELVATLLYSNAGAHNAIYRGKKLGTSVAAAQWAAIAAGTYGDMYIGDYWVIDGVNWRIAAFDYYYGIGDTDCTTHHVVIVPDTALYTAQMNTSNVTTGAYVGSTMYKSNLANAKTAINNAFGASHILSHRQYLQNATTGGYASAGSWYDSTVELMTEQNVYGCKIFGNCINGTNFPNSSTVDKSQFPLFALDPTKMNIRSPYWLRDVASTASFCRIGVTGVAYSGDASASYGVRPVFSIKS